MIQPILMMLWYFAGIMSYVFYTKDETDLTLYNFIFSVLVAGPLGPITWLVYFVKGLI